LDDWLAAEREVDAQTSVDNTGGPHSAMGSEMRRSN
jgi:hypothetical protein